MNLKIKFSFICTILVKGEEQARQALSGVAGLLKLNRPSAPDSERAAATASLMAKKTELPRKTVGSPIPCRTAENISTGF